MTAQFTKPIIKWVGGKTQILECIMERFPRKMVNYHEPFLGGGSVLLGLLTEVKRGSIELSGEVYAYDANEALIYVYKNIQTKYIELYNDLQVLIGEYNQSNGETVNRKPTNLEEAKQSKENYYYWTRSRYNNLSHDERISTLGSAMFIFMNKTCFRGVFRVGPNGFNVPFGNNRNPEIINRKHLEEVHQLIQGVHFEFCDFSKSIITVNPGDFVYMDPPYAPEKETSFVGYTENGFDSKKHKELFKLCDSIAGKGIYWMMSNSDVPLVREYFSTEKYTVEGILCKRSIHSKNPDTKAKEVIISTRP
jgi:DNA adenine methylase